MGKTRLQQCFAVVDNGPPKAVLLFYSFIGSTTQNWPWPRNKYWRNDQTKMTIVWSPPLSPSASRLTHSIHLTFWDTTDHSYSPKKNSGTDVLTTNRKDLTFFSFLFFTTPSLPPPSTTLAGFFCLLRVCVGTSDFLQTRKWGFLVFVCVSGRWCCLFL